MDVSTCIRERRSLQEYTKKDVTHKDITTILDAAVHAPNAGNTQSWRFVVVKDAKKRKKIAQICEQEWMEKAPVHIVVCGETELLHDHYGERGYMYNMHNCAAAIQNMLLQAHSLGLATCWVGHFDEDAINKLIKVKGAHTQAIITVGYSKEIKEKKRTALYTKVFFEEYGNRYRETDVFPLKEALQRRKKKKK